MLQMNLRSWVASWLNEILQHKSSKHQIEIASLSTWLLLCPLSYSPLERFLGSEEFVAALKPTLEGLVLKMQRPVRLQPTFPHALPA